MSPLIPHTIPQAGRAPLGQTLEPLPKWSDDPATYRKAWIKRKRTTDPVFAREQADKARGWQRANPVRNARNQYRQGALRRGLAWELSDDLFERVVTSACHYCGFVADPPFINGVDRIDNTEGYTPANIVTACAQCNYAKRHQSVAEFLTWVDRIATFRRASNG